MENLVYIPPVNEGLYDLDVAISILSDLSVLIDKKADEEEAAEIKEVLICERDLLLTMLKDINGDEETRNKIVEKAFNYYAPILRNYYSS